MQIKFWQVVLFAIAALSVALILVTRSGIRSSSGDFTVSRHETDGETVRFKWTGPIEPPMASKMAEAFNDVKMSSSRIVIDLDSPGGLLSEGDDVIAVIRRIGKTHRVETYVGSGARCLSMCVPIYLQGRLRVAARDSEWMFHDVDFEDSFTGQRTFTYEYERRQASSLAFYKYFERSDIEPEWRDRLAQQMRVGEVWKTGQELSDERSGVVTVLE